MRLVYFSHSYRPEDASIVRYFAELISSEGLLPVLDPPSEGVNTARLQRQLRDSDGMVVVLTRRDSGVSPHILFEASLCLQARKPLLVYIEDVLSGELIPSRVLRSRFSRKWFFRQVREHRQAARLFRSYLGEEPPPKYQPSTARQTCLVIGFGDLDASTSAHLMEVIGDFGYEPIADAQLDRFLYHSVKFSERLACADLAVQVVDSASLSDQYAMGAVRAAFVPCVSLTANAELEADEHVPSDYWPRFIASDDAGLARLELSRQLTLYEQAFVELETPAAVTQYVNLLIRVSNPIAAYDQEVRGLFVRELHVGDQYNVNQAAAVGPQAHAHDITFQQLWTRSADKIDLEALALDLGRLRSQLKAEANNATEDAAVGQIALAETAAKEKNGPGVLAHLKAAGQWALSVAEKIGVAVATGAIKTALGL